MKEEKMSRMRTMEETEGEGEVQDGRQSIIITRMRIKEEEEYCIFVGGKSKSNGGWPSIHLARSWPASP